MEALSASETSSCARLSGSGLEAEDGAEAGFLAGPKARRRSLARSRYSGVVVVFRGCAVEAFASLAAALVTREASWRLSRWSWLRRECLLTSVSVLNWREQR